MRRNPKMRPTDWHFETLGDQLGQCSRASLIRYVEFANQLPSGNGSLNPFDHPRKTFLSRQHFSRAIDLASRGHNVLTTVEEELAASFGIEVEELMQAAADDLDEAFKDLPPLPL